MDLSKQNILFFPRTMGLGGTENVVLQLCEIFKPLVNNIVVCSCGGENVKRLEKMGIKHYMIPDIEDKSLSAMLQTAKQLRTIVREENITVIHTHHRMAAFYVTFLQLYRKCYFFNTCHGIFADKKFLTKYVYRHAKLIACGKVVKKNLIDYFNFPNTQIEVIQNSVPPFDGIIQEDKVIKDLHKNGCFIVANISRLSEEKGISYFIGSLPKVLEKHPNVHYVIIGSGKEEQNLRDMTKELKVDKQVHFLGYRTDVQSLMTQVDLVVLSSLTEGLPLAPIEAFSVGRTIVATAAGGTLDVVEDEETGFLVEPKNSDQIADKITWLIEHPEEKRTMEVKAKKQYEQEFSVIKMTRNYIGFYKNTSKMELK